MRRGIAVLLSFLILFACAAAGCAKVREAQPSTLPYVPATDAEKEISTEEPAPTYDASQVLDVATSWQTRYALSYSFYRAGDGESVVLEAKTANCYQAMDQMTGIITYLTQEDGYVMEYVLDNNAGTGTMTIVTDSTVANANSGFVQLSACDPYLPVYANVEKAGGDYVAKRAATRYKQTQLGENGDPERIAYIWIDDEYAFVSRCELYEADGTLLLRWELQSFTTDVKDKDVELDISEFKLTQQ